MHAKDTDVRNEITKENKKQVRSKDLQSILGWVFIAWIKKKVNRKFVDSDFSKAKTWQCESSRRVCHSWHVVVVDMR